ncbi:MAG TPA: hypothetical protein VLB90_02305 [Pseudomonadales bacterium]|nr:hypothetical protein [Pseudomonadales bacterium]
MEMFFWKKNRLVDQFAKTLADDLFSYLQPAVVEGYFAKAAGKAAGKLPAAQIADLERRIKDVVLKVQHFKTQQSLGIYRKARLHLIFTERLKELGFSEPVAQEINKIILLQTP